MSPHCLGFFGRCVCTLYVLFLPSFGTYNASSLFTYQKKKKKKILEKKRICEDNGMCLTNVHRVMAHEGTLGIAYQKRKKKEKE